MEIKKKKKNKVSCGFKLREIMKEKKILGLNDVVEPPRCYRDKGVETTGRSSTVALNGVVFLSLHRTCFSSLFFMLGLGALGD